MATKEIFLNGKCKWARTKVLSQYGKWSVVLYPDAPSLDKIKTLIDEGIKNELKKDDDGYYITFSRPSDRTDRQGRKFTLVPVTVVDNDGRIFNDQIGNGSDIAVKLEVYGGKTPSGTDYKAARLAGIKVFNLVPYKPEKELQGDP